MEPSREVLDAQMQSAMRVKQREQKSKYLIIQSLNICNIHLNESRLTISILFIPVSFYY